MGKERKIYQFSALGELLNIYSSASEAARQTGINKPNISRNANHHTISNEGFVFNYENKFVIAESNYIHPARRIGELHGALEIKKWRRVKDKKNRNRTEYLCYCDKCKNEKWIIASDVIARTPESCGCLRAYDFKKKDITGKEYGFLKVIEFTGETIERKVTNRTNTHKQPVFLCECQKCGKRKKMAYDNIKAAKSCGCLKKEKALERVTDLHFNFQDKCLYDGTNIDIITRKKPSKNNKSGVIGVHFNEKTKMWIASLNFKGKPVLKKQFSSFEDAVKARKEAEEKYHKPVIEKYMEEKGKL